MSIIHPRVSKIKHVIKLRLCKRGNKVLLVLWSHWTTKQEIAYFTL